MLKSLCLVKHRLITQGIYMWLTAKYKQNVKTPPGQSFTGGHLCWLVHVRGYKQDHKK